MIFGAAAGQPVPAKAVKQRGLPATEPCTGTAPALLDGRHALIHLDVLAATLHPHGACDRIEREVPQAVAGRDAVSALRCDGPVQLDVQVRRPHMTEHALLVPGM